jgi:molybdopterin converting factor small subunit
MIHVKVLFFAGLRERFRSSELDCPLPEGASIGDLMEHLLRPLGLKMDEIGPLQFAKNLNTVPRGTVLEEGDEVALLPPMSGG